MKPEHSGNIYKFPLEFNKGYAYAEILDYSDVSDFDGILIQVFNYLEKEQHTNSINIDELKKSGIMFGPAPINKYPSSKGKSGWVLIAKDNNYDKTPPYFKHLKGLLTINDWSKLRPWYKQDRFGNLTADIECNYDQIRHLETMILNHIDSIKTKVTMMKIIEDQDKVSKYYDLKSLSNKNLFLQVINTYYDSKETESLLSELEL